MKIEIPDNCHFVLQIVTDGKVEMKTNIENDLGVLIILENGFNELNNKVNKVKAEN
jgi:hypothetical protein